MKRLCLLSIATLIAMCACEGDKEHMAEAISPADSLAFMRSRGVSTLISDSGVMRYRLVAEEWDIYTNTVPYTWKFLKGLFMERFDKTFHPDLYVQADTAYLHEQRTWELRGRVVLHNTDGTVFKTEELFWDMNEHKMWNHTYMHIVTPERELEGTDFRSNEEMTDYYVSNSAGSFPTSDTEKEADNDSTLIDPTTEDFDAKQDAAPIKTPNGQKAGKVMPSAPGKYSKEGHWK